MLTTKEIINKLATMDKLTAIREAYFLDYNLHYEIDKIIKQEEAIVHIDNLNEYLKDLQPLEICKKVQFGKFNSDYDYHKFDNDGNFKSLGNLEYYSLIISCFANKDVEELMEILKKVNQELYDFINTLE